MRKNLIIQTDSYKQSHAFLINKGLTKNQNYAENRAGGEFPTSCFLGLDVIIKDNFLNPLSKGDISEARDHFVSVHGFDGFDLETWTKVQKLGYLPIEIKAVPEGTVVGEGNVLFTTVETEPWFAKTVSNLETLQMHYWYPTAVNTREMYMKMDLLPIVKESGSMENLPFMVNDFGARGAVMSEGAAMGGIGHLVHFQGSDNNFAALQLKDFYNCTGRQKSIIATEHTVALSYGPGQGEFDYVNAVLDYADKFPGVPCAWVIDTFDALNHLKNVVGRKQISERIKNRPGRVILRPDSGDPKTIIGQSIEILASIFNYSYHKEKTNYKVLNYNVGLIQGDGMTPITIPELYDSILRNGWSSDNLATGSGGGILQVDINRDTQRAAIKTCYGIIDGEEKNFQKTPKTDLTKSSKSGQLKLHPNHDGTFTTISSVYLPKPQFIGYVDALLPIYKNGEYLGGSRNDFKNIIERAETYTNKFL